MLERLNVASYKGVRFPCNDVTTTAGRALIKHEFANSNRNNIEDQGLNPRIYTLVAVLFGDNYFALRDQLLSAIESPGPGVLIHPFYGRIENAVAQPVNFNETVKRLGRVEIPITFEISDSDGIPSATMRTPSGIAVFKDTMIDTIGQDMADTFNVTTQFAGNFSAAVDKASAFADSVSNNVILTTVDSDSAASFRSKLDTFSRDVNDLVQSPSDLADGVTGLIRDVGGLYDTSEQTLSTARSFFGFGSDDQVINPTTAGLAERKSNNDIFNETVRASSLAVAYEAAAFVDYRTVDEIAEVSRALETEYRSLKG